MFFRKPSIVIDPRRLPAKYHSRVASKLSDVIGLRNGLPAVAVKVLRVVPMVRKFRVSARDGRAISRLAARRNTTSLPIPNLRFALGSHRLYLLRPISGFVTPVAQVCSCA